MKNTLTLFILTLCQTLLGQELISIPAGTFTMGCTTEQMPCSTDDVQHQVSLDSFYIATYEVTQEQYEMVMGNNPSNDNGTACTNCPIENVSWYDAINFCNALSIQNNVSPVYYAEATLLTPFTGNSGTVYWDTEAEGYRLPTEAEWEYAARSAGTENLRYAGSNNVAEVAAYNGNSVSIQAVGSFIPNSLGLYDMTGNVSEFVWDNYANYTTELICNPLGPTSATSRVHRGGNFSETNDINLAIRSAQNPNASNSTLGFRVCSYSNIISQTVDCVTTLTTPSDGATDVSAVTDIVWEATADATGYSITLGTSSAGTDLLTSTDIGNVLNYKHIECFPENTTIYVNITAYNDMGNAVGCTEFSFTIFDRDQTPPLGMVYIPCSVYEQGCTAEQTSCDDDENPPHYVRIDGFFIGEYEVTQSEWAQTVTDYSPTYTSGESDSHAAYNISWYDAITYLNRKSINQSLTPVYYFDADFTNSFDMLIGDGVSNVAIFQNPDANGFRLPTEAEWEYAARGGANNQTIYSGSDNIDEVGHYQSNSGLMIQPVGEKTPNAFGLYDMTGNVWEFCQDWYDETYYTGLDPYVGNPTGNLTGTDRIARGGSVFSTPVLSRIINRDFVVPSVRSNQIGFRVIKTPLNEGELACAVLSSPANNATNIPVTTNIEWQAAPNATGYRLSLGTTTGGTEITNNQDLGNILSYNPTGCLPGNTTIYINITPYNDNGDATGCTEFSFTTADTTTPEMVSIPAGTFEMGCTDEQAASGCGSDESPVHTVTLDAFEMSKYEVTQCQWEALVPEYTPNYTVGEGGTNPVYSTSWYDAATYANRLSIQEGYTPVYYSDAGFTSVFDNLLGSTSSPFPTTDVYWNTSANGYRLPTEAEWEYAARGGSGAIQTLYSGSDTADDVAWFSSNSGSETHPVGEKQANALGLHDMSGNVWEWCWDWYDNNYYDISPMNNPTGPIGGFHRVLRGGSWNSTAPFLRVADRFGIDPGRRNGSVGFRLSRTPSSSTNIGCVPDITIPTNAATNIPVTTNIEWQAAPNTTGYRLSIGTTTGGTEITNNQDLGNILSYTPTGCLPGNTTIYINITPYNDNGDATGCTEFSFTTADTDPIPPAGYVYVPCGSFEMGCTDEQNASGACEDDESPVRTVTIDGFFMSQYEVTQAEWEALVPEYTPNYTVGEGGTNPVYRITWYDAATYANRLSIQEGLTPAYYSDAIFTSIFDEIGASNGTDVYWNASATGYRLPTEAEWEYAARGGGGTQTLYSGSDTADDVAWYGNTSGNSGGETHPVGEKQANALGLYDMSGNVYEWCWDWYDSNYYDGGSVSNPMGPIGGSNRVRRGGSWGSTAPYLRVALRGGYIPGSRSTILGFRLSRTPSSSTNIGCVPDITIPSNAATNIPVTTNIEWQAAPNATGYRISIGTTTGGTEITNNQDLGNILSYNPTGCLPSNTTIYINITPYNDNGDATGCTEFSFTTADTTTPEMVSIPAGTFEMGCTDEQAASGCGGSDESPVHTVTLDAFEMSKYEVTQCQWEALVPEYTPNYTVGEGGTNPVYSTSWYDAATYANRLSIQEGLTPAYYSDAIFTSIFDGIGASNGTDVYWNASATGYRLPTEAEWEYAARGGGGTQTLYSGSDTADDVAWYISNSGGETHPVGEKQANALGLYDMSGNVYEWCWDWYDSNYYDGGSVSNPTGPIGGSNRVLRGGSWFNPATSLRVANRSFFGPGFRTDIVGFRLSRTP